MPFLKMSFPVLCTAPQDGHGRSCASSQQPGPTLLKAVLSISQSASQTRQWSSTRSGEGVSSSSFKHFAICCVCSSFLGKILQNEFNGTSAVRTGVRAGTDIMPALGTLDQSHEIASCYRSSRIISQGEMCVKERTRGYLTDHTTT